jgi:cell division protein FtsI (penicillin-binding protein 3)
MRPIHPALSLRLPIGRARVLLVLMGLAFTAVGTRAFYLQALHTEYLRQEGESRYARVLELPAHRGVITDRNGERLAISTAMESVWATPSLANISGSQRTQLAELLGVTDA